MSNPTVPAAAEGMPTINRRTFLRSSAGAAALGGMVIMTSPSAAAPTIGGTLASLIETHRRAYAAVTDYSATIAAADRAFFRDRASDDARQARDEVYSVQDALLSAEKSAFLALLAYPVSTLDELRAVVAVGKGTWWEHDTVSDDEAEALIAGIMAGRA